MLRDTVPDVYVDTHIDGVVLIGLGVAVIFVPVKVWVQAARCHVDELTFEVSLDQLRWVVAFKTWDEFWRQVWVVLGLDLDQLLVRTILFDERAVRPAETFWRRCDASWLKLPVRIRARSISPAFCAVSTGDVSHSSQTLAAMF